MIESTEVFVLTVLRDNVLDACETFMLQQDALQSAIYFTEMANIKTDRAPVYDSKMKGWVVADEYGYFVSVVRRQIHNTSYMIGSSYGSFLDALAGRGFARRGGGYGLVVNTPPPVNLQPSRVLDGYSSIVDPITQPQVLDGYVLNTQPAVQAPTLPVPQDNPMDYDLPGGFGYDDKPKTMLDLLNSPTTVRSPYELNDEQKWALVLARTKHRPHQILRINAATWDHSQIIAELASRSSLGLAMRNQELEELDRFHQRALDLYYEESSSSSEEEDSED